MPDAVPLQRTLPVAVIGAGPGAAVREWGHVRMFSPRRLELVLPETGVCTTSAKAAEPAEGEAGCCAPQPEAPTAGCCAPPARTAAAEAAGG
jgi:hypothetical protein